jgi:hypothetical protein
MTPILGPPTPQALGHHPDLAIMREGIKLRPGGSTSRLIGRLSGKRPAHAPTFVPVQSLLVSLQASFSGERGVSPTFRINGPLPWVYAHL